MSIFDIFAANRKFPSPGGNIPDLPHVIVCPVNLREQWQAEIKRFLTFAAFDVFPYVGRYLSRKTWWETLFQRSQQPKINRIILATISVRQLHFSWHAITLIVSSGNTK